MPLKFELNDSNKQISDSEILNDIQSVANRLGKKSLKIKDYCQANGARYNYQTAKKRFGRWENVLQKAGLKTEKSIHGIEYGETSLRPELLIEDLIKVATELQNPQITIEEYDEYGKYGSATIQKRFGGWNNAKIRAGLKIGRNYNVSYQEYMQNILDLWTLYGRQPKYAEIRKPDSKYSITSYESKFGSWRVALEKFIEYINAENDTLTQAVEDNKKNKCDPLADTSTEAKKKEAKVKRTPRSINLRLRFTVLKRDNFSCKKCGKAPAKNPNVVLHVDHIIPWSKGGESIIENLETLCDRCNLGKSNIL